MIVTTSEVAILLYSPELNAATASAEKVKNAASNKNHPKKRPKIMLKPSVLFDPLIFRIRTKFKKNIKKSREKSTYREKNQENSALKEKFFTLRPLFKDRPFAPKQAAGGRWKNPSV